jgi:hypothetical protein
MDAAIGIHHTSLRVYMHTSRSHVMPAAFERPRPPVFIDVWVFNQPPKPAVLDACSKQLAQAVKCTPVRRVDAPVHSAAWHAKAVFFVGQENAAVWPRAGFQDRSQGKAAHRRKNLYCSSSKRHTDILVVANKVTKRRPKICLSKIAIASRVRKPPPGPWT